MNRRNLKLTWSVVLVFGLLTSCGFKTDYKASGVKMPDLAGYKAAFTVCDKKDSEQPLVPSKVLNNKIVVQDEVESRNLEFIDCDGRVTGTGHGPVRTLNKSVIIDGLADLPEAVRYVSIENFGTCSVHKFDAQDFANGSEKNDLPDGKVMTVPASLSGSDQHGRAVVQLSDSKTKLNIYLNVRDGLNVLKVKYFGKCKKPKAQKNDQFKSDSYLNCDVENEIGSKDVALNIQVRRPEVSGTKQIDNCYKR